MKCGVAGATGYLGAELLRLLADHPTLDVAVAQADTTAGAKIGDVYPALGRAYRDLLVESLDTGPLEQLDVVFVALPSGTSQELVAALAGRGLDALDAYVGRCLPDLVLAATVPIAPSRPARSSADATTWAEPGGVRSTSRLPELATSTTHSPSTRRRWSSGAT